MSSARALPQGPVLLSWAAIPPASVRRRRPGRRRPRTATLFGVLAERRAVHAGFPNLAERGLYDALVPGSPTGRRIRVGPAVRPGHRRWGALIPPGPLRRVLDSCSPAGRGGSTPGAAARAPRALRPATSLAPARTSRRPGRRGASSAEIFGPVWLHPVSRTRPTRSGWQRHPHGLAAYSGPGTCASVTGRRRGDGRMCSSTR